MRSLIGKVIQVQGNDLKNIPENNQESVVVFTETKNFSVEKQRKATFNIMNPRRVVFMGSSGNEDPTTRAERREEELERRRNASVLANRAGVATTLRGGAGGGAGGGEEKTVMDGLGSILLGFGTKLAELTGLIAAFRVITSPFKSIATAFNAARTVGTTAVRGARSIGSGLVRGAKGVYDFLTKSRSFRGIFDAARSGARTGAGSFMKMVKNVVTTGMSKARQFGGAMRNLPTTLRTAATAIKGASVAKFLAGASRAGKLARFGLSAAKGIGTLGLSVLADYLIYESAAQADKLKELLESNNAAMNSMGGGLDKKVEFAKIYNGVSAREYHTEQAKLFAGMYPEMLKQINANLPKDQQMTEDQFINSSEHLDMAKYKHPTMLNPDPIDGTKFSDFVREHSRLARENTGTIDAKKMQDFKREQLSKSVGNPQLNDGGIVGYLASLFTGNYDSVPDTRRQQSPYQNMDDLRLQEARDAQNPQFRNDGPPLIINTNQQAPPNTLFQDGTNQGFDPNTRPDDVRELAVDENPFTESGYIVN